MRRIAAPALFAACVVACGPKASDSIEATGTLEVTDVNLSATVAARVTRILVKEGAIVHAGDTLAILTQPTLAAETEQRGARAREARAALSELEHGSRAEEISRAEADLSAAEADAARAARDADRLKGLADKQIVSAQQYEAARALATTTAARRDAAKATRDMLREGARQERVQAARAEADVADAATASARATATDLVLRAPFDGIVSTRNVEEGEVATPGTPVLTVSELKRQSVRVFVSQAVVSRIQPGQAAHGTLDAYPGRDFAGHVASIATKAEFTPRVALTERERSDLLFAVKVEFSDTTGMLKAGLPITVRLDNSPQATPDARKP